jgi:HSP20 family protein
MSNMRRYDPFSEMMTLRDAVSQLFEDSFVNPARFSSSSNLSMALNVSENPDGYIVEAVVPGVKSEDLEITLEDNVLTIRGESRHEQETGDKQSNFHIMERRYGRFSRSVRLPAAVKTDEVQATLEDGILRLEIPKAEEVKPRRISVAAGRNGGQRTLDVNQEQERGA